ncbi:MAG TPA: hypothetical protein VEV61_10885 [Streptosporangiaceae bacterium]|nr:hypothetical protein [Streptosporangiaceae bacterium]
MAYQPYPTSGTQSPPQRQSAPSSIQNAVKLMYAGMGISLLAAIFVLATSGSIRRAIGNAAKTAKTAKPLTAAQLHNLETSFIVASVVIMLIAAALWFWMAWANRSGKSWARVVATILFGFNTLWLIYVFRAATTAIIVGLGWLVGLGAILLLWRRESTDYINSQSPRALR